MSENERGAVDAQAAWENAVEAQMREQERRGRRPSRQRAMLEVDEKFPQLRQRMLGEANS